MSSSASPPMVDTEGACAATTVAAPADDSLLPPEALTNAADSDNDLSTLPTQVYLERTVMGVLALALEDVCRVRPPNPVDYLGSYLLRRSTANNTVEVTYEDTVPKAVPTNGE
ncbi:hypothetical protein LSCM1_07375 [Leishmania martiniquensis]|uniref:Protein dpy-30 homolog n=1 Tax=Leishmania martiniquensis TaxID=1580590 RepID=A0A836GQD0_9TRYP|nr:hypothetical protein LSCM1_07375 [Leishmania martiniquensis]